MLKRATIGISLVLAFVAALVTLAGCSPERPVVVKPPPELLSCQAEPIAPVLPAHDQQAARDMLIGVYVLALVEAGQDCRSRVDALKVWAGAL
jgi:hypothetical protein